jgi:tRNA-dihydrouridine synthase A
MLNYYRMNSSNTFTLNRTLSVAPMMDYTDRHCCYFLRLISRHVLLYTEMITANAILHGDPNYLLKYHPSEHPIALQLGGSNPNDLAKCAKIGEEYGFDEINLNVGCPSDHVTVGHFGACLIKEPKLVADCIAAMRQAVKIPVTIKTRIGVDDYDSYDHFKNFIQTVANAGCEVFIIHARKAWLKGLSPKENREIPPLQYATVYHLKQDFPQLTLVINGGINSLEQVQEQLTKVEGVMIGREAYHNPYMLAEADQLFYRDNHPILSRHELVFAFIPYIEQQLKEGVHLSQISHHLLGMFQGIKGARAWRRYLSEHAHLSNAGVEVILQALPNISENP